MMDSNDREEHRQVTVRLLLPMAAIIALMTGAVAMAEEQGKSLRWTHFTIADPLPGSAWGTGGIPLADFDGDGDLDIVLSRRETQTAYWFERTDDATWVRHTVGRSVGLENCLGAAALDIDRDGLVDVVLNRVWFKNPGQLAQNPDTPWPDFAFAGGGHDIIAADVNGNGYQDIITYGGRTVSWFDPSADMRQTDIGAGEENHGGIAPRGAADLDGDGDVDVVIPGYWFANPGDGRGQWQRRTWPHLAVEKASYGTSMRAWIADVDRDGHNDIVYSDCDTGHSHVYWVKNLGKAGDWRRYRLPDPSTATGDVAGTGSFHSLGVADFDGDGDLDIFAGEQEDPDTYMEAQGKLAMKPRGLKERGVIWLHSGGSEPTFVPVVIQRDNPGWHDAVLGDVDQDGDIDMVTKIWNKDGSTYHADFWRNDTLPAASAKDRGIDLLAPSDLRHFRQPSGSWFLAGTVASDPANEARLAAEPGTGVLVNGPDGRTDNILTRSEFGDVEVHIEFMVPKGSNSGIYLMGRYEIQVFDSWEVANPDCHHCGAIYERWDDKKDPAGYEGRPPLVNASGRPGTWQSYDIIFRAPRFDAAGKKTANALFIRVIQNGKIVQRMQEVTGPTRAATYESAPEAPTGPIMLQGDHGPVAYRNFRVTAIDTDREGSAAAEILARYGYPSRALPMTLNHKDDGYRGIWYMNQPSNDEYVYKYSGGLGTYCAKHRPFAVYCRAADKTFFCYGGATRKNNRQLVHMVSYYDHRTGQVPRPTILLDKNTSDAHDNPVISVDAEGYIWIFSTSHGTGRPSFVHQSMAPYNIDKFRWISATKQEGDQQAALDNFSYMQCWSPGDQGFVAFFTRYNYPADRTICFMSSPDGIHWSSWQRIAAIDKGHYQISEANAAKAATAFNYHPAPRGLNWRTNLYYLETPDGGRSWQTAAGQTVSLPLTEAQNPALVHDYQAEGLNVYLKDICLDDNNRPVILYLTSKGYQSGPANDPRWWMTARWSGQEWIIRPVTRSDNNYDMGSLYLDSATDWRIVAPTQIGPQPYNPGGEMAMWHSSDQGQHWRMTRQLTDASSRNHTYARRPVNAHPDFYALWADGHGRKPSESRLYFCNRQGQVFQLPETMDADYAVAQPVVGK